MEIYYVVCFVVGYMIYRRRMKRKCRKYGHVWLTKKNNRLRCDRCKAKHHRFSEIKPER